MLPVRAEMFTKRILAIKLVVVFFKDVCLMIKCDTLPMRKSKIDMSMMLRSLFPELYGYISFTVSQKKGFTSHLQQKWEVEAVLCVYMCDYIKNTSAVSKIASSFSCSWHVNINSLTLVSQWRCRSVSRGWLWRCGGRCWGWGGRQTGTPPADLDSRRQRTLSYTHTGTWKRNRCCLLLGGRIRWQMSLLLTPIWGQSMKAHGLPANLVSKLITNMAEKKKKSYFRGLLVFHLVKWRRQIVNLHCGWLGGPLLWRLPFDRPLGGPSENPGS